MKPTKVLLVIAAGMLLIALVFFAATPRVQIGRGPQGEIVRLEKVTYGTKHRFAYGNIWQRLLSLLPINLDQTLSGHRLIYETTNHTMVAWLVWKGQSNTVYNYVPSYILEDEDGHRVKRVGNGTSVRPDNNTHIQGCELIMPRRSGKFRLYLFHLDGSSRPVCNALFNFSTPARTRYEEWQAESLPVHRTNGGVEFSLTGFRTDKQIRPERGFASPLIELTVAVREKGQLSTNWQMAKLEARDAIGNDNTYGIASYQNERGEETWEGTAPLWIDEVWKLRLEFKHRSRQIIRSVEFVAKPQFDDE